MGDLWDMRFVPNVTTAVAHNATREAVSAAGVLLAKLSKLPANVTCHGVQRRR
jgi:hypothetical protein